MRYVTFSLETDPVHRLGVVHGDRIVDLQSLSSGQGAPELPGSLMALIRSGPAAWRRVADFLSKELSRAGDRGHASRDIRWHAPIPRPLKNVICVGWNYVSHVKEAAAARGVEFKLPKVPVYFTKAPMTVNGPYDVIAWDRSVTREVDWEVELGVIVGVSGRNIPLANVPSHVFGYTVINDVSARDLQREHSQFFKGKSLDGFCPMGPVVVTADEFGDPHAKSLALRVNGVVKQEGRTSDMIFPIDLLIEWLSRGMTVEAGDIVATGTPPGVGFARTPPEFLQDGDVVEAEIEGIGTLRNRIAVRS